MAVRNTLGDLHNLLMEQMERLSEADGDQLEGEIGRSKAIANLAAQITANARTVMQAQEMASMSGEKPPRILTDGEDR